MSPFVKKILSLAVLAGMALQSPAVLAIDVGAAAGSAAVSMENTMLTAGLNSEVYKKCTAGDILGALENIEKNWDKILEDAVKNFITEFIRSQIRTLMYCALAAIHLPWGIHLPVQQCTLTTGSDAKAALQATKKREMQQNFVARCTAAVGIKYDIDAGDQYMQQRGPYGSSPAWVTSWEAIPKGEQARAQARWWNELANADICPYMRDRVYAALRVPKSYIDNPVAVAGSDVDAGDSFVLRAECTLPDGFTMEDYNAHPGKYGGYLPMIPILQEPQNNFDDFVNMATAELATQTKTLTDAAMADAISGGGVLSVSDCVQWSPDGKICLAAGPNKQTGGTLRDQKAAATQAQYAWMTSTNGTDSKAVSDMRIQIVNRLVDLGNSPLDLKIEFGQEDNTALFAPSPSPSASPGSGDAGDLACAGNDPRCTCVRNDQDAQSTFSGSVAAGIAHVMQDHPEMFVSGTSQIAPGTNYRDVLAVVCDAMAPPEGKFCEPSPSSDDQIIILGPLTFSVQIITPDGHIMTNGGVAIRSCPAGVQD